MNASDDGSEKPVPEASKVDARAPKLRSGMPPDNGSKEPLVPATVTLTDKDNSCESKIGLVQLVELRSFRPKSVSPQVVSPQLRVVSPQLYIYSTAQM